MKNFVKYFLALLFIAQLGYAQIIPSFSNLLRYGDGKQSIGGNTNNFIYRENITDVKFSFQNNFTFGFRFLYDNPPEVGQKFMGLDRRFIEYANDGLNLRAGNFSELYGRGLALNLFEDRGLAYNTWMDGVRAKYKYNGFSVSLLSGNLVYSDSISFWRNEEYTVVGGNIEFELNKNFSVGTTFLSAEGKIPLPSITYNLKAEIPEIYFKASLGKFDFFANWVNKWTNIIGSETSAGNAIYSFISYNKAGTGITIDYKNYLLDERGPYERDDFTRPSRMLPFQNPPIVMKEHSYLFLSRSIHHIDFNDEVGFQAEIFYSLNDDFNINFNASLASRHNFYEFQSPESNNPFTFEKIERKGNFLPTLDEMYSPYWEYLIDAEYNLNDFTTIYLGFAQREKILYNDFTGLKGTHIIKSTVIPFLVDHILSRNYSSSLHYEFESVNDNYNTPQEKYNNHFISLTGNFHSKLNVGFRFEFTTNEYDLSGKTDWFTVETGYRLNQSNTLTVSYGSERGGQTCSNGVCRYVLPFSGIKFSLLSTFN
jgi:hypothetical protein